MTERRCPTTEQVALMIAESGGGPAFPIGAVYLNVTGVNPGTELGYGTWSQIASGQFLVGQKAADADFDTAEETGGEKTHTLSVAEMPVHVHREQGPSATSGGSIRMGADTNAKTEGDSTIDTLSTGGGGAHNNLPPYFVVYIWKRTA